MAHVTGLYKGQQQNSVYMETVYPVLRYVSIILYLVACIHSYLTSAIALEQKISHELLICFCSMFSLMFLHLFLYGCNIFAWRKTRINYSFIFELAPTKGLKYRDVFLICTMAMTAVVGLMLLHLTLLTKGYSYAQVQVIPGLLFLVIFFFTSDFLVKFVDFVHCIHFKKIYFHFCTCLLCST